MRDIAQQSDKLTPQQRRAIACLLTAKDVRAAAEELEVNESTVHRWMRTDTFRKALRAAEDEAIQSAVRRLSGASGDALDYLVRIIQGDEDGKPSDRVRAALGVLAALQRLKTFTEIEEQLATIEAIVSNKGGA